MRIYAWENCQEDTAWLSADDAAIPESGFCGEPLAGEWEIPQAHIEMTSEDGRPLVASDFTLLNMMELALSETAVGRVGDLLGQYGELLPVRVEGAVYYAYNVTTLSGALDEASSDLELLEHEGERTILWINRHAFKPEVVADAMIFKLDVNPCGEVYLTESALERLRAAGLDERNVQLVWEDSSTSAA